MFSSTLSRVATGVALTAAAVTGAVVVSTSASADTDPVTGGTTTVDVSLSSITGAANAGLVAVATKPATVTYDTVNQVVEYSLPVTGGNASVNTFYGTLKHAGGLIIVDYKTKKSVTLSNITFDIESDTVSATPGTAPTSSSTAKAADAAPVVFFDALGSHQFQSGTPETFSASDLQVDAAGAAYLNKALGVTLFKAGQHVGTFFTSFTNSNDA